MSGAPFAVHQELTGVALAYKNPKGIADDVAPRKPVGAESFKYHVHELKDKITLPDTRVGRKSAPTEVEFASIEKDASTQDHGLQDAVPQSDIDKAANIKGFDPLITATENLTDLIELAREVRVAGMVFNPATYGADNKIALTGGNKWSDYANSDPIATIKAGLDACVIRPNIGILGRSTWSFISSHPKILTGAYKRDVPSGIAERKAVADLFELDDIFVGESYVNLANPGQAVQRARVWGGHASFIHRDPLADFHNKRATFALTAQFGQRIAAAREDGDIGLKGGQRVRVGEQVKELAIADDLGYFIENAV